MTTDYTIEIQAGVYTVEVTRLRKAAVTVLHQHSQPTGTELAIEIVDNARIHQLNRDFREVDSPTDVLSFPSEPPPMPDDIAVIPYLGDLALAYPYTAAQAEQLGYPLSDMLVLLVVHGTLHLLGYDHDTPANRAEMWAAQEQALDALGISRAIVPTLEDAE